MPRVSITFTATDEYYSWILSHIEHHAEKVSDNIILDTKEMYDNDKAFKALVKEEKRAKNAKYDYINKHHKPNQIT